MQSYVLYITENIPKIQYFAPTDPPRTNQSSVAGGQIRASASTLTILNSEPEYAKSITPAE